jgi:branched-chain amino acid transport system substrate-binding protein
MCIDDIKIVIPFWRADIYGDNLVNGRGIKFRELGGTVIDGVVYKPRTGDFSSILNRIYFIICDQKFRSSELK